MRILPKKETTNSNTLFDALANLMNPERVS